MLRKVIEYVDFNDQKREDICYFNLTDSELMEVMFSLPAEVTAITNENESQMDQKTAMRVVEKLGGERLFKFVKDLILKSYGEKTSDGRGFAKDEQATKEFAQSLAFDTLLMELMSDDNLATEFMKGILSKKATNALNVSK